ncbi:hypothetical protein N656DRAFT_774022 [Canariomyces notabilis]|uniref:Uncharacterized protein n=1 Tax=Canariomyces notabilis TaxID=2074819 RepID=A0AAN6TNP6_9PEZI|nr:hypothetical protein N656DRAFT_774022 [Canariomyces arenarius]
MPISGPEPRVLCLDPNTLSRLAAPSDPGESSAVLPVPSRRRHPSEREVNAVLTA